MLHFIDKSVRQHLGYFLRYLIKLFGTLLIIFLLVYMVSSKDIRYLVFYLYYLGVHVVVNIILY